MEKMSATDVAADEWSAGDKKLAAAMERMKEKLELLKASPAEFKTFSREDQRYWVFGQIIFKGNYLLFGEKVDEVVAEEEEPDSESSEESEPDSEEESESEEEEPQVEEESEDQPSSKESKRNDNMEYGPRGLAHPTTTV